MLYPLLPLQDEYIYDDHGRMVVIVVVSIHFHSMVSKFILLLYYIAIIL